MLCPTLCSAETSVTRLLSCRCGAGGSGVGGLGRGSATGLAWRREGEAGKFGGGQARLHVWLRHVMAFSVGLTIITLQTPQRPLRPGVDIGVTTDLAHQKEEMANMAKRQDGINRRGWPAVSAWV